MSEERRSEWQSDGWKRSRSSRRKEKKANESGRKKKQVTVVSHIPDKPFFSLRFPHRRDTSKTDWGLEARHAFVPFPDDSHLKFRASHPFFFLQVKKDMIFWRVLI
jgi:hypothetical protein